MRRWILGSAALLVVGLAVAASLTASWNAVTQDTGGATLTGAVTYNLYVGPTAGSETLAQAGLSSTSAVVSAQAGVQQCAQVTAVANGVESARSNEVCAAPPFPTPKAPVLNSFK